MNDAATRGHPLHPAGLQITPVTEVIFVQHVAIEQVSHRLEAAMGVRGKAGDVVAGIFRRELVQHQKGIDTQPARASQAAAWLYASAIGGVDGFDDVLEETCSHSV